MLNVLDMGIISVKNKLHKFFTEEKGEVNIVTIIVLIGIAIICALTFKEQIQALIERLFATIGTQADNAVKGE